MDGRLESSLVKMILRNFQKKIPRRISKEQPPSTAHSWLKLLLVKLLVYSNSLTGFGLFGNTVTGLLPAG